MDLRGAQSLKRPRRLASGPQAARSAGGEWVSRGDGVRAAGALSVQDAKLQCLATGSQRPAALPARPVAVVSPHALMPGEQRRLEYAAFEPGESLLQYFERTGIAEQLAGRPVVVTIDGARVHPRMWAHCRPRPGRLVRVQAVVESGGGGGKNPISTVISLGLMILNPGLGLATGWGFTGFAATLVGGAINFGIGMIANALFAPPRPNISDAAGQGIAGRESPTYSLAGGSNRARPFEPLPMIAGTHRYFADLGARTYTEFQGDDQYLYQVFDCGYNDITLSDFKIGATSIDAYADVTLEVSGSDGALTLFPGNVDTLAGADITHYAADYTVRTSSPDCTALAVEVTGSLFTINSDGQVQASEVYLDIVYRAVGSSTWLSFTGDGILQQVISATRTPVRRTWWLAVAQGQYEVGVRKASADSTDANQQIALAWSQLRCYQPDSADYNGRTRIALKIRASGQLSGQVAQFSAIARARCEVWNGAAWVTQETRNPAWWFRAIALGRFVTIGGRSTRVWGAGLASGRIDHDAIKAWGAWCDAKGLTFNGVFDQAGTSAADMLDALATMGRGSKTYANGKLSVVWDQAAQPVSAVFSMSNILPGSFSITYMSETLADEVLVRFINPDLDWQSDTVRCLVPGTVTPTRPRSIELFGCTDKDLAGRAGNLYAAQNAYRTRRYTWSTDFEGMPCRRGDVVQLAHDLASFDYSGRLLAGSTDVSLKLDRTVPLTGSGGYVTVVKPDQTFDTYRVNTGGGDTDTLTLASAMPFDPGADVDHPEIDYKWLFGSGDTPGRVLKIDTTQPQDENTVQITAFDELDVFYAAENAGYVYTPPRPVFGVPQVSNLQVAENGIRAGSNYLVVLSVTWDAYADYGGAELWAVVNGGARLQRGTFTRGRQIDFTVADGDVVDLELVAFSSLGRIGQTARLTASHTVSFADNFAPADVTTFLIDDQTLSWLPVLDVDLAGYRVKFNYGQNTDWGAAQGLHEGLLTASPWTMPVRPVGAITLMIKGVDWAGIESENAALIYTDLGDPVLAKLLETFDLHELGFPGTISGGSVSGGDLVADSTTAFWNSSEAVQFWSDDSDTFWPASLYAAMAYAASITPTRASVGSTMKISSTIAGENQAIEYRPQGPQQAWDDNSAEAFWQADTATFWPAPPDYQPWPGSISIINQPYDIRVSTGAGAVQGMVTALAVLVDTPYITERLNDVTISAGGTRLPITGTYQGIDNVQLTVQNDGNGAVGARIEDKDADLGPLIKTINDSGSAVAGRVDAFIQGY